VQADWQIVNADRHALKANLGDWLPDTGAADVLPEEVIDQTAFAHAGFAQQDDIVFSAHYRLLSVDVDSR
jgi:hypothetical protein